MRAVILVSAEPPDLSNLAQTYQRFGVANLVRPNRLVVETEWGWFAIENEERLLDDFSPEELSHIELTVAEPFFSLLHYSTVAAVNLAIEHYPQGSAPTLVDNDHDMIQPIEEIKRRIQKGEEWHTSST